MKINKPEFKLTLKSRILLWFGIIIIISLILYGFLIYAVYQFNFKGENYHRALKENPKIDQSLIDKLEELNRLEFDEKPAPPPIMLLPPGLFMRILFTITGGVLAIIIIAAAGGFLFLRRMLNQVDFITKNVKEINDKKLHIRLNLKGKDPISNMAKTFDNMLDQIETSFNNQKHFIQNVSHELNTPMTVIKTKIDALKQKKSITSNDYRETIELVESEVMRLSRITGQLLVLSDIEENGFKEKSVKIDFKSSIEMILRLFENAIGSRNLQLTKNYESESDINGNQGQIEQMIFNLLDNAVKYNIENGKITIRLYNSEDNKSIVFEISNPTDAIQDGDLSNIFKRFFKTASGSGKKGFGLGLPIVKKIVEKNNGNITVDYNQDLKEISFKASFPIA